jgi:hypothetical protein
MRTLEESFLAGFVSLLDCELILSHGGEGKG